MEGWKNGYINEQCERKNGYINELLKEGWVYQCTRWKEGRMDILMNY